MKLGDLSINLEVLLLLWLLESFSLRQLLALAAVVALVSLRSLRAPSSSRRSPS